MKLIFSPIRYPHPISVSRVGDTVIIEGLEIDLSGVPELGTLPLSAVDCPYLAGPVTRTNGELTVPILLPHGACAPDATRLASGPLILDRDGEVALPAYDVIDGEEIHATPAPVSTKALVDLSQAIPGPKRSADALASARDQARADLRDWIGNLATRITGNVPLAEMLSWAAKETAARHVLSIHDASAMTPEQVAAKDMLDVEASVSGDDVEDLAQRIVANADAYRRVVALLTGSRRKAEEMFDSVQTPDEVEHALLVARQAIELALFPPG